MTYIENNEKPAIYKGGNIHGIYRYIYIIGSPKNLNYSINRSHTFGTSYSIKNHTASLQTFTVAIHVRNKII